MPLHRCKHFHSFFLSRLIQKVILKQIPEQASLKDYTPPYKTTAHKFTLAGITGKPTAMPRVINKFGQSSPLAWRFGARGSVTLPAGSPRPWQDLCTASNPAQGEARWHGAGMQQLHCRQPSVPSVTQPKPRQVPQIIPPLCQVFPTTTLGFLLNNQRIQARSQTANKTHIFTGEEKAAWAFWLMTWSKRLLSSTALLDHIPLGLYPEALAAADIKLGNEDRLSDTQCSPRQQSQGWFTSRCSGL